MLAVVVYPLSASRGMSHAVLVGLDEVQLSSLKTFKWPRKFPNFSFKDGGLTGAFEQVKSLWSGLFNPPYAKEQIVAISKKMQKETFFSEEIMVGLWNR